jgi:hypothetical protein
MHPNDISFAIMPIGDGSSHQISIGDSITIEDATDILGNSIADGSYEVIGVRTKSVRIALGEGTTRVEACYIKSVTLGKLKDNPQTGEVGEVYAVMLPSDGSEPVRYFEPLDLKAIQAAVGGMIELVPCVVPEFFEWVGGKGELVAYCHEEELLKEGFPVLNPTVNKLGWNCRERIYGNVLVMRENDEEDEEDDEVWLDLDVWEAFYEPMMTGDSFLEINMSHKSLIEALHKARLIWTELDSGYIVSGMAIANRVNYFVSRVPYAEGAEIVVM